MGDYFRSMWRCRYFWMSLVKMDLRSRYHRSALGIAWSMLQPICMTAIFTLVFCPLTGSDPLQFAPNMMISLACWQFITTSALLGCQCFFLAEPYIRQFPAPIAIYPLRTILGNGFHGLISLTLGGVLAYWSVGHFNPLALCTLLPTILMLGCFGWALATLAGLANVYFRDTQHLAEIALQAAFYLTPILYKDKVLNEHGMTWLMQINPFLPFIRMMRMPFMEGIAAEPSTFLKAMCITIALVSMTALALRRYERRLIFQM